MFARINGLSFLLTAMLLAGCANSASTPPAPVEKTAAHTHDGWWCGEHGIPEAECAQCDSKLAAKLQKEGDWCMEHQRPDSQCFVCHPELAAKFAARYEAKYGQPPPKPGEGHGHDHGHDHGHKHAEPAEPKS